MNKTFVIGDIHGALKALVQVIERTPIQENDQLIFLGDFVDGWSQSFGVVQYLLELQKKMACIFIKGNHDLWCQQWLEKNMLNEAWLLHGGRLTVESYKHVSDEEKLNHLQFFQRLQNYYIDNDNRLFIHAGFSSQQGPANEHPTINCSQDRTLWEMALCMDKRIKKDSRLYPKRLKLFNQIFIGHTPTIKYGSFKPMKAINVWNIDTGAAFNGRLCIMEVESKKCWQSDVVQTLYREKQAETGGNYYYEMQVKTDISFLKTGNAEIRLGCEFLEYASPCPMMSQASLCNEKFNE